MMEREQETDLEAFEDKEYRAGDLFELVGLTYRQINDWEERAGIMSSERATSTGWRKFSGEEVMALAVCAAVRRQFQLPLEKIRNLYRWLLGKEQSAVQEAVAEVSRINLDLMRSNEKVSALLSLKGDELKEALEDDINRYMFEEYLKVKMNTECTRPIMHSLKLAHFGLPVYVVGLETPMILTEFQLVRWVGDRHIKKPSIVCPLNDIFNEVLVKLKQQPFQVDRFAHSFADYWNDLLGSSDLTKSEREVIRLIREGAYQRVTVHVKGREVIRADVEEDLTDAERTGLEKAVMDIIGSKGYQTVVLTEQDGKLVQLKRKTPRKLK
jgi:DNA-binding transcriptional MerR regulator